MCKLKMCYFICYICTNFGEALAYCLRERAQKQHHNLRLAVLQPMDKVKVKVMLRPTVSRLVCVGVKPYLGLNTRFLLLSRSCGFVHVERPISRSSATSFLGLVPCCTTRHTNVSYWLVSRHPHVLFVTNHLKQVKCGICVIRIVLQFHLSLSGHKVDVAT